MNIEDYPHKDKEKLATLFRVKEAFVGCFVDAPAKLPSTLDKFKDGLPREIKLLLKEDFKELVNAWEGLEDKSDLDSIIDDLNKTNSPWADPIIRARRAHKTSKIRGKRQ